MIKEILEFKFGTQLVKKLLNLLLKAIIKGKIKRAIGALLIYDCTKRTSFENLEEWFNSTIEKSNSNVSIIIIGNKNDLEEKEITEEEGKNYALKKNKLFLTSSAKTGENIEKAFTMLTKKILNRIDNNEIDPNTEIGIKKNNLIMENSNEKSNLNISTIMEVEDKKGCNC